MTISEMIHEIPHMRYRLESAKHKETLDEIEEVLRHHKEINEVLDQIRAEIKDLDDADYDYEGYYKAVTDALAIIDKYKAESENKE